MKVNLISCARCGGDHEKLPFKKFTFPVIDLGSSTWDWWGMCPIRNEPILMLSVWHPENEEQPLVRRK